MTITSLRACMLSCSVRSDSATPWTKACQAPLSMKFPRQEYWSRLPLPTPGDLPDPGIEPTSQVSLALAGIFLTTCEAPSPPYVITNNYIGVEYINESIDTPLAKLERCFQVICPEYPLGTRHCSRGFPRYQLIYSSQYSWGMKKSTAMITLLQMRGISPESLCDFSRAVPLKNGKTGVWAQIAWLQGPDMTVV